MDFRASSSPAPAASCQQTNQAISPAPRRDSPTRSSSSYRRRCAAATIRSRSTATSVFRSATHGSTMNSPGSRSSWLITAFTETDTPGTTAPTCALTRAVTCSRSCLANGRTSTGICGPPRNAVFERRPLPVRHGPTLADPAHQPQHRPNHEEEGGACGYGDDSEQGEVGREADDVVEPRELVAERVTDRDRE